MQRLAIGLTLCLGVAATAHAQSPGVSNVHGKSLETWMMNYLTWYLEGADENADGDMNVVFLPLPVGAPADDSAPDGRPIFVGEANVSLEPSEAFALPLSVFVGERYKKYPKVPDDPKSIPGDDGFLNAELVVELDGKTLIDSRDDDDDLSEYFFGPVDFEEPIVYAEPTKYHSVAAIWATGLGMVHHPLTPGEHTLYVWSDNKSFPLIFENTWTITVE